MTSVVSVSDKKNKRGEGGATTPPSEGVRLVLPDTSEPVPKELGEARGICFTVYKYEEVIDELREEMKKASYGVFGYETCPDTGRPHLQCYIHYKNQRSLMALSKKFGKCHVEKARGTPRQASDYCKYDDYPKNTIENKYEEFGELPQQGKRKDWDEVMKNIKDGMSVDDIVSGDPHLIPFQRAIREVKQSSMKPINRNVTVIVLYGKGGTGKTRWAHDNYPELYKKPCGEWWNGYEGQKVVLLDDFYGWVKYHDLLTLLDRYAVNLPYKGGYIWAQYDTVIITSNKHPKYWYKNEWGWPLRRRLNKIIHVRSIDGETSYEEEAFPADEEAWLQEETGDGA